MANRRGCGLGFRVDAYRFHSLDFLFAASCSLTAFAPYTRLFDAGEVPNVSGRISKPIPRQMPPGTDVIPGIAVRLITIYGQVTRFGHAEFWVRDSREQSTRFTSVKAHVLRTGPRRASDDSSGAQGTDGKSGADGAAGRNGATGAAGADGGGRGQRR
jgi:hypothetical protein